MGIVRNCNSSSFKPALCAFPKSIWVSNFGPINVRFCHPHDIDLLFTHKHTYLFTFGTLLWNPYTINVRKTKSCVVVLFLHHLISPSVMGLITIMIVIIIRFPINLLTWSVRGGVVSFNHCSRDHPRRLDCQIRVLPPAWLHLTCSELDWFFYLVWFSQGMHKICPNPSKIAHYWK